MRFLFFFEKCVLGYKKERPNQTRPFTFTFSFVSRSREIPRCRGYGLLVATLACLYMYSHQSVKGVENQTCKDEASLETSYFIGCH